MSKKPVRTYAKSTVAAVHLIHIDLEEFLPAPQTHRIAEQKSAPVSLQDSLVGALGQFQVQCQQKSQQRVEDLLSWLKYFTLYVAVMAKKRADMVPIMMVLFHTVYKLYQKAPTSKAWLEYDIQFWMEAAASKEKCWLSADSWQFISCLPNPFLTPDPLEAANPPGPSSKPQRNGHPGGTYREDRASSPPAKKGKKSGTCRLFNKATWGMTLQSQLCFRSSLHSLWGWLPIGTRL